jgi:hypothetical protein
MVEGRRPRDLAIGQYGSEEGFSIVWTVVVDSGSGCIGYRSFDVGRRTREDGSRIKGGHRNIRAGADLVRRSSEGFLVSIRCRIR